MKTLFVTDLDGTLLNENALVSNESIEIINSLQAQGMWFSYATARSFYTSSKVTKGLICSAPVITKNGTFINDSESGKILLKNIFSDEEAKDIYKIIRSNNLCPIVNSYQNGKEIYSYDSSKMSEGLKWFLGNHENDERMLPLKDNTYILSGEVSYFSCLGKKDMMKNAYDEISKKYRCVFSKDTYDDIMWLEIMPKHATKADAILQLKKMCECDYIIVFGDGINDISMFKIADEGYAVQNAVKELKEIATGIIDGNQKDGVAKWLEKYGI